MAIRPLDLTRKQAKTIEAFASTGASSCVAAHGSGESHVYVLYFEPGGEIGPHPAGFDQVFLTVQGSGWISGSDGVRHSIEQGCGAFIPMGEHHSKGSKTGMVAVMVQASQFGWEQEL
jgi:quercetin dioxygenase-like cupin family protein